MEGNRIGWENGTISRRKMLATIGAAAAGAIAVSGSAVGFAKEAAGTSCAMCVDSLADLIAIDESELQDGQCFCLKGYRAGTSHGGGTYVWDASRSKSAHNGGTVIDPNRPLPTDWMNDGQVASWFLADTAGQGCYTRVGNAVVIPEMYGADPGGVIPSQRQITKCAAIHGGVQLSSKATYLCTDSIYFTKGNRVAGYGRSTILRFTSGGVVLSGAESKEFSLDNFLITTAGSGQIALDIIDANVNTAPTRWSLSNLFLYSETVGQGTGCRIRGGWIASVFNLIAQRFAVGVDIVRSDSPPHVGFNGISFVGGELQGNGVGFRSRSPLGVNFFGTAIEGNTQFGARLENGTRQVNFDGVYFESNGTANVNNGADIAVDVDDPLATIYGIAVRGSIFLRGSSGCKRAVVVNKAIGLYLDPACSFHGYENALVLNEIVANGVRGGMFDTRSLLSVTGQPVINNTLQYGNPTSCSFSLGHVAAGADVVTDGWLGFVAFGTGIANRGAVDVIVNADQAGTASFRLTAIDTATNAPFGTDTPFNANLTAGINKINVAYNFESGGLKGKNVAFKLSRQGESPADTNAGSIALIECFVRYYA